MLLKWPILVVYLGWEKFYKINCSDQYYKISKPAQKCKAIIFFKRNQNWKLLIKYPVLLGSV